MVQPVQSPALVAAQAKTLARLAAITQQLDKSKGSDRLGGKVCIITGAGSEKGIGFVAGGIVRMCMGGC